ncbi:Zinc finger BED domain-containing protein 5 [Eumeta japonica]|uniref:Zinc finger BED domain-containing protein 5 n=1 Tax=Eumeta variegata TaxID=151549 RepID=A0A4C1WG89_EUMVA|nr:Zinc finger BED domain-containing protein 5 [Eumeta japonica]
MSNGHRIYIIVLRNSLTSGAITDPDDDATTSSSTVSKTKKRKYDKSYISFRFVDSNGSPPCMLCSKLLPNSSKLHRYFGTVHPESKNKNKEFFVRKKEQLLESQKNMMHVTQTINEKATEAPYLVSYRSAQAGEAHAIAENIIKPCVLAITKCMLDEKSASIFLLCRYQTILFHGESMIWQATSNKN